MIRNRTRFFAFALLVFSTPAWAGPLATDTNSYLGIWHGSTPFVNGPLTGTIDWAVYAPNSFPGAFGGYTPTVDEFVYTYQVYNTGTVAISQFNVALVNPADNIGNFSGGGVTGDTPSSELLLDFDSAIWDFDGIAVNTGTSAGLAFSSPMIPMPFQGSVINGGFSSGVIPVPSPSEFQIPEPGTIALATCGFAVLAIQRLRRRGRKAGG